MRRLAPISQDFGNFGENVARRVGLKNYHGRSQPSKGSRLLAFVFKCPTNKTIDSVLGNKCFVYKMVSLMFYIMYVIVDSLPRLLPGLFMSYGLTMLCFREYK